MELTKWPEAILTEQTEEAMRVRLCFRGKDDYNWYCVKLRIPKDKLVCLTGGGTAADDPKINT